MIFLWFSKNDYKQIDTTNALNSDFFELNKITDTTEVTLPEKRNGKKVNKKQLEIDYDKVKPLNHVQQLSQEKLELDVQAKKLSIEKQEIEIKEISKELLNAEKTFSILRTYNQSMMKEIEQRLQTMIQSLCSRHSIDTSNAAKYKYRISEILNESNKVSVDILMDKFKDE